MASPAPLTEIGSFGVRTRKRPAASEATRSIASGGVSSVCSDVTMIAFGPSACSASMAASASRRVAAGAAGQMVELELVRRHDVGGRHRMLAHEFRNARPHEDVAPDIADHRIAAVARLRVRGLHARDRIEDRGAGLGRAHVARQHAVALAEHAALGDPLHQFGDQPGLEHAAGPGAIAGVVGELHGMDRPHLDADPLQRKRRGGVADMAVGDVRLDREDVHDSPTSFRERHEVASPRIARPRLGLMDSGLPSLRVGLLGP